MYNDLDCPWFLFDNSYRSLLGICLIIVGSLGLLLNGWLFITFIHSHLLTFKSHILVLNLCCASLGRNIIGGFVLTGVSALAKRWLFGTESCELFGFYNQFMGLLQMTSLAILCLDRYLQIKSYRRDKELSISGYTLLISICWIWTTTLCAPTLAGFGGYSCDITRTSCTLDWTIDDAKSVGFLMPYILGGLLVPISIMLYSICAALPAEKAFYRSERMKEHRKLTESIVQIVVFTMLFWLPQAMHCAWISIPPLVRGYHSQPPLLLSMMAYLCSEFATSIPVLCFLIWDPRIRTALLGRMKKDYGIIKNKSNLPFNTRNKFSKF